MLTFSKIRYDIEVSYEILRVNKDIFFSRRIEIIMQITQMFLNLLMLGIFAQLVDLNANIEQYGVNSFLDFFIIGQAVNNLIFMAMGSISGVMMARNFAGLFITPMGLGLLFFGMNLWRIIWRGIMNILFLIFAILFFNLTVWISWSVVLVFILSYLIVISLDMFAAGFLIITKAQSDPLSWFLTVTLNLVSGTYFPPENLPIFLQPFSLIHPQTHILKMARLTIGGGYNIFEVFDELILLLFTSGIFLLIGYLMFQYGFKRARVSGTLGHV